MMRRLLPWWTGPLHQKGYYARNAKFLSLEELATLRAITGTFLLLFLGWLVVEVAGGVLLKHLDATRNSPWVGYGMAAATPVVGCCLVVLARRIVASRHPERTAAADAKAAVRLGMAKAP